MTGFLGYIQLVYVLAAACFVIGLHLMNSPATARRGNQVSMPGMVIAVVATLVLLIHYGTVTDDRLDRADRRLADRLRRGPVRGADGADDGDAAAGVGVQRGRRRRRRAGGDLRLLRGRVHVAGVLGTTSVFTVLDVLIGSVTFSGSIIAAGKLQGFIPGQPIIFKGAACSTWCSPSWPSARPRSCFTTASLPALLIVVLASLGVRRA